MKNLFLLFFLIASCGQDRPARSSSNVIVEEEVKLDPELILNQEILNCSGEENLCKFEKFQELICKPNQINGVIYPEAEIINSEDISLAPTIQFTFNNIDYTEIEKIQYKYIKLNKLGEKIAETDYKILSFIDNNYQIPIHVSNLGAGILNSDTDNINQLEILIKNHSNIYYKSFINFYLFSTSNFPVEIYRDPDLINNDYYSFQNQVIHTLDAIHLKNNLNSKTIVNFAVDITNITDAGIKTTHRTNTKQNVSYYESIPVYFWSVVEDISYSDASVTPNYLIIKIDEFNNLTQIPYLINNNAIIIQNLELKELEHVQLLIQSNFEKLNILGNQEPTTLYTNYSHCQILDNMNFCKCRYSASSNNFSNLLIPPSGGGPIGGSMWYIAYSVFYISLMNNTSLVPNCTNSPDNLILTVTDSYKILNELTGRYHKTETSIFLDVYLKGYENFGSIGSKYLVLPNLEVTIGTITQSTTQLSGYLLDPEN